jgi:HTH-type transcriptional regulator / antitoxin HipB
MCYRYRTVTMLINSSEDLGKAIRQRRKQLRLSQEQVAGIVGVNRRVVGELERGKRSVQLAIALEVTRVLGLDLDVSERTR